MNNQITVNAKSCLIGKKVEIAFLLKYLKTKVVMATNFNPEYKEGVVATIMEEQTAKLPSDLF